MNIGDNTSALISAQAALAQLVDAGDEEEEEEEKVEEEEDSDDGAPVAEV